MRRRRQLRGHGQIAFDFDAPWIQLPRGWRTDLALLVKMVNEGDADAKDRLWRDHRKMAVTIAKRFQVGGEAGGDLSTDAYLQLIHAANKWNPGSGQFRMFYSKILYRYFQDRVRSETRRKGLATINRYEDQFFEDQVDGHDWESEIIATIDAERRSL